MRIAIIGRTEILFETMTMLMASGHEIALIVTSKEAPEYTKTAEDFENFAKKQDIPYFKTAKIDTILEDIRSAGAIDIAVSMNYAGIISQEVIDCFPLGILNAHGGDLPRYRGNACQAWAILNGEEKIGLCIHRMIGGELDSGDITARAYLPITIDTKVTAVWKWMADSIPGLFTESVEKLARDANYKIESQSKDPKEALRCYPRLPEDGRIDWSNDAKSIVRLVNACNKPYAGAFCFLNDRKLIVWDAVLAPFENFVGIPGQIAEIRSGYVDVLTGAGKLRLRSVEQDNGDVITPDQLITSTRTRLA